MLISAVRRIVDLCSRYPWPVVVAGVDHRHRVGRSCGGQFRHHDRHQQADFPELEWRKRELAYEAAFPGPFTSILVVVDAPTPELAAEATAKLAERLSQQPKLFHSVRQLDGDPFFAKNGLLFQSEGELARTTKGLTGAGPIIGALAADPTLRGLTRALSFGLLGVQTGGAKLDDLIRPLTMSADTVDQVLAGQPASFSWHVLLSGRRAGAERSCATSSRSGRCWTSPRSSPVARRATPSARPADELKLARSTRRACA